MKGIQGLILAIGLGVAGALFNFAYLNAKAQEVRLRGVVGVSKDLERGETITMGHLEEVQVPENVYERLKQYTVPWEYRRTAIDMPAARSIRAGDLLLKEDMTTSAWQMNWSPSRNGDVEERGVPVTVDSRFIASLYKPGDLIEFAVNRYRVGVPTPARPPAAKPAAEGGGDAAKADPPKASAASVPVTAPSDSNSITILGPFKILSIGNRLGDANVMRSSRIPQLQENVLMIKATKSKSTGELDAESQKLLTVLQGASPQQVTVLMVPRTSK